jgi:hypothetical protein
VTDRITIEVYRTHAERAIQVQIVQTNEHGTGTGYRLAGPKHYNMGVTELIKRELDARDAAEIRNMLDKVFPHPEPDTYPPALPWAKQLDADDLAGFLADLYEAAVGADADLDTLADVESAIGRWRAIGEATEAHRTAPGPETSR